MSTGTSNRVAEYKGRKYRLLFCGPTKFGKRAKLAFWDGSKEFWVDASLIREMDSSVDSAGNSIGNGSSYRQGVTAPHGRTCPMCGSRECARAWNSYDLCDED